MKKLHLIIVCILYSLNAIGQQIGTDDEVMQLTLPKGTSRINKEEYNDFMNKRYDKSSSVDFHDHVFKKNRLLIYYSNSSVSSLKFKRSLESSQRIMVGVFKQYSKTIVVDTAKIIVVNNIRFSIIEYHENDVLYIRFTSDYDKSLRFIVGFIEYKKSDEVEAKQYLKDLLQSMHFKG